MEKTLIKNIQLGIKEKLKTIFQNSQNKVQFSLAKEKYLKHLPRNRTYQIKLFNHYFNFLNGRELLGGIKEIFNEEIYKQSLPENAYILDCGAHIGLSVLYLKQLCPTAQIVAFEPDDQNAQVLIKNISSFQLQNVTVIQKAVWIHDNFLKFNSGSDMGSHIQFSNTANIENNTKNVPATRLKNYINQPVHFLKLDIEGAEYEVMKDIENELFLVQHLFLEYHGNFNEIEKLTELFSLLTRNHFTYYIKEAMNVYKQPFYRNQSKPKYDIQLNIYCFRK